MVIFWFAINIADSLITYVGLNRGCREVWFIYQLTGNMLITTVLKYVFVALVVCVLARFHRLHCLVWFAAGLVPFVVIGLYHLAATI